MPTFTTNEVTIQQTMHKYHFNCNQIPKLSQQEDKTRNDRTVTSITNRPRQSNDIIIQGCRIKLPRNLVLAPLLYCACNEWL